MPVSKEDWILIKGSTVWEEFRKAAVEAIEGYGAEIINRSEANVNRDMYVRGAIRALIEILAWEPELIEEETTNE